MKESNDLELPHLALLVRLMELEAPESAAEAEVWGETRRRLGLLFTRHAEVAVVRSMFAEGEIIERSSQQQIAGSAEKLMEECLNYYRDKE